jgi:hypothetical protein
MLLKIFNGVIEYKTAIGAPEAFGLDPFAQMLRAFIDSSLKPFLQEQSLQTAPGAERVPLCLGQYMMVFEYLLDPGVKSDHASQNYSMLTETLIRTLNKLLSNRLDVLKLLIQHIPIRTLIRAPPTIELTVDESMRPHFRGMKRDIVTLLNLLMDLDKRVKDKIRESGGIPLLLSLGSVDDDNPCKLPM